MMKAKVVIHNKGGHGRTFNAPSGYEMHDKVFDYLYDNGIDELKAIECASWCELACDGESFNEEEFDVYIEWN